jgi:hypothetical protein
MAVVDGYMPTPREGVARHVDASEITRSVPTTNATDQKTNRQRVNISDPEDPNAHGAVKMNAGAGDYGQVVRLPPNDVAVSLLQQILDQLVLLNSK